ncbi:hypothetical protein GGR35_003991 [Mucilaginibacter phyllosphaerae]|uniref:Uncharacterized protein n=1 Tax=Mucilaginibacter phyllosphaerae TaxID=1812349 RepID=A0ABR6IE84_9SPHI|nr:hypothetical protein [Mucilaginibacter phyllosphaerae]
MNNKFYKSCIQTTVCAGNGVYNNLILYSQKNLNSYHGKSI